jgi:hypothetical protein
MGMDFWTQFSLSYAPRLRRRWYLGEFGAARKGEPAGREGP